jgi:hypothetical protein
MILFAPVLLPDGLGFQAVLYFLKFIPGIGKLYKEGEFSEPSCETSRQIVKDWMHWLADGKWLVASVK